MKKVVLFVAVLMFAGAVTISAQEAKLEVALAGNASFTFGINLDAVDADGDKTVATGISNGLQSKATLTILAAADYEKGGKEGEEVYGWIKLKDVKISGEANNEATFDDTEVTSPVNVKVENVEAKLFLGPIYINVLGVDNVVDLAGALNPILVRETTDYGLDPTSEFAGIAIGLKDESVISLVLGVSSRYDFLGVVNSADGINVDNEYLAYAKLALKAVENLTAEVVGSFQGDSTTTTSGIETSTLGIGGKLGFSIALAESINLFPFVAVDMRSYSYEDADSNFSGLQFQGGLNLSLPGSGLTDWDKFGDGYGNSDGDGVDIASGLTASFSLNSFNYSSLTTQFDATTDLGIYFYDADLIPVLNLLVVFELSNFGNGDYLSADPITTINQSAMAYGAYAEVVLDQLKPWAYFYTSSTTDDVGETAETADGATNLAVGVDITVITNTTFSISYENHGIAKDTADLGLIKFTTKISY